MMYKIPRDLESFRRSTSYIALLLLTIPIQFVGMSILFYDDRYFLIIYGAGFFCIGLIMKMASRRLETNISSGISLVELCLYLSAGSWLAAFAYMLWTNVEILSSTIGVLYALMVSVGLVGLFLFLKNIINNKK